jgi:hypothetical protein
VNLPELSRDERAALAYLLRIATKFGAENCRPKRFRIAQAINRSARHTSKVLVGLEAFQAIEREREGSTAIKYRILWNEKTLRSAFCSAYDKDCAAFCAAHLCEQVNGGNFWIKRPLKGRNAEQNAAQSCSALLLSPPPNPPRKDPMSEMPDYYRGDLAAEKLWRAAQRWIALNNPDLSAVSGDRARPIMYALEAAGYLDMPEDGPLPAIAWPPEAISQKSNIPARKPMGIASADIEALRRQIGRTE